MPSIASVKRDLDSLELPAKEIILHYLNTARKISQWLQIFNTEKDTINGKHLLVQSHTSHSDTKLKDFKVREAILI